jgi:outer membrane protein assembly factor BamE (lipoprotein component of BamABCDE complex)
MKKLAMFLLAVTFMVASCDSVSVYYYRKPLHKGHIYSYSYQYDYYGVTTISQEKVIVIGFMYDVHGVKHVHYKMKGKDYYTPEKEFRKRVKDDTPSRGNR